MTHFLVSPSRCGPMTTSCLVQKKFVQVGSAANLGSLNIRNREKRVGLKPRFLENPLKKTNPKDQSLFGLELPGKFYQKKTSGILNFNPLISGRKKNKHPDVSDSNTRLVGGFNPSEKY